jgi:hypothetical protein
LPIWPLEKEQKKSLESVGRQTAAKVSIYDTNSKCTSGKKERESMPPTAFVPLSVFSFATVAATDFYCPTT